MPIPTVLCYDVEDIIAPEADDAALWLAGILAEEGLTGTFMVMGELARLWERRGRRDVVEALKRHHLAFHSTWHSVHPTTTEICLERDFRDGMEAIWEWDRQGWDDAQRILGRPLLGWARTGNSWSPSVMGLMGRKGRAYAYSQVRLPGHNVCWFANCLGFYGEGVGGFDHTFYDDALFEQRLAEVRQGVDRHVAAEWRGAQWLCFFVCHPTCVVHTEFWDAVNFAAGANPPREEWKPARRHPDSLIPTMQKNYRRLCDYLRSDSRLQVVGWGDLIRRYDAQRPFAMQGELEEIARRIVDENQVIYTDHFSAAEILVLLARAVCRNSTPPELGAGGHHAYPRPTVYGPLETPPASTTVSLPREALVQAAAVVAETPEWGYLPAAIAVAGESVGIGTLYVLLAHALLGRERAEGPRDAPYPASADAVASEVERAIPDWIIHPPNMDLSNLLEQTRLQCWTLKPAWPRESLLPPA